MPTKSAFIRYCKSLNSGRSPLSAEARACVRIGGRDPAAARRKVARAYQAGTLDEDSYAYQMSAVEAVAEAYADRSAIFGAFGVEDDGWDNLGEGSRMRREVVYGSSLL